MKFEKVFHKEVSGRSNEEVAKALGIELKRVIKCLIIKAGEKFYAFVIPGDKKLNLKKVSKILEISKKKIRFAREDEIRKFGFEPGLIAVTIIEKLSGGFVDREVLELDFVIGSSGKPFEGWKFDPKELLNLGYKVCECT